MEPAEFSELTEEARESLIQYWREKRKAADDMIVLLCNSRPTPTRQERLDMTRRENYQKFLASQDK